MTVFTFTWLWLAVAGNNEYNGYIHLWLALVGSVGHVRNQLAQSSHYREGPTGADRFEQLVLVGSGWLLPNESSLGRVGWQIC